MERHDQLAQLASRVSFRKRSHAEKDKTVAQLIAAGFHHLAGMQVRRGSIATPQTATPSRARVVELSVVFSGAWHFR